ncbi:MAG: type II toxin-antitoxin system HicA family toxin [Synergistaceae bacterium]|nr:type II toxin-antitoxin system HicA family toxin [Synergistaceae bacterium]
MSVKRRDIIRHFKKYGFYLKREGARHSFYTNGKGINIPIKRHNIFTRIQANQLCKEAGIPAIF